MKGAIIGAAACLVAGPIVGLGVLLGAGGLSNAAASLAVCPTTGPVSTLTSVEAGNARTIVAATQQSMLDAGLDSAAQQRAELIALMTADTESTLHNYSNPAVPASELKANDGSPPAGGNLDSLGLFQQRGSWGSVVERMTPADSTRLFVRRLLNVPAWQTLAPGVAAQSVQVSAYPDRYAATESSAQAWLTQIARSPATARCGSDGLPDPAAGPVLAGHLPAGYAIPPTATDAEQRAVTFALTQLGKPYVFGGTGPDAWDCSGLTMAAWASAGVQLPHYTVAQWQLGEYVPAASLLSPGDLIFIPGSDGSLNPPNPQHVGMYIGDGYVIEAPQTGEVVKIVPLVGFGPVIGMRRYG